MENRPKDNCESCPVIGFYEAQIADRNQQTTELMDGAFSDKPDQEAQQIHELASYIDANQSLLYTPQEMASKIRQEVGEDIEAHQSEIEKLNISIELVRESCKGPLAMRAIRDNTEYTARICTSPEIIQDGKTSLPAKIKREET